MSKDAFSPKEHPVAEQHVLFPTDILQLPWKALMFCPSIITQYWIDEVWNF